MSVPELVCYFLPGCWAFPFLTFRGQKGIQWMSNVTSTTERNPQGTVRGISLLADVCSILEDALQKQCHKSFPLQHPLKFMVCWRGHSSRQAFCISVLQIPKANLFLNGWSISNCWWVLAWWHRPSLFLHRVVTPKAAWVQVLKSFLPRTVCNLPSELELT